MNCWRQLLPIVLVTLFMACGNDDSGNADGGFDGAAIDAEEPLDAFWDALPDVEPVDADGAADGGPRWDGRELPDVAWELPSCVSSRGVVARAIVDTDRTIRLTALVAGDGRAAVAWASEGLHVARIEGSETVELSFVGRMPFDIIELAFDGDDLVAAAIFPEAGTPLLGLLSFGEAAEPAIADAPPWAAYWGLAGFWASLDERWFLGVLEPRGPGGDGEGHGLRILQVSRDFDLLSPPRWLETGADTTFPEPGIVRVVGGPEQGIVIRKVISDERGRSPRALEMIPFTETVVDPPALLTLHGAYAGIDDIDAADMRDGTVAVLVRSRLLDIPAPTLLAAIISGRTGVPLGETTAFAETSGSAAAMTSAPAAGVDFIWQPVATQLLGADTALNGKYPLSLCGSDTDMTPCAEPLPIGAGAYADAVVAERDGPDLVVAWHETGPVAATDAGTRRVEGIYWARLSCD